MPDFTFSWPGSRFQDTVEPAYLESHGKGEKCEIKVSSYGGFKCGEKVTHVIIEYYTKDTGMITDFTMIYY